MRSHRLTRVFPVINWSFGMAIVFYGSRALGDNSCGVNGSYGCVGCGLFGCQGLNSDGRRQFAVPISGVPLGNFVKEVHYSIRVKRFNEQGECGANNFPMRCSDVELTLTGAPCIRSVKLWGPGVKDRANPTKDRSCSGDNDGGNDDDTENDPDIELHGSIAIDFDGCLPNAIWALEVKDVTPTDNYIVELDTFEVWICHAQCIDACDDGSPCTTATCSALEGCVQSPANPGVDCGSARGGVCEKHDACGTSGNCVIQFQNNTTVCRGAKAEDLCDKPETCPGDSPDCPADTFQSGTVCRAAAGVCDQAETCSGDSPDCPEDEFQERSIGCRVATGPCDLPEFCTESSAACPANEKQADGVACTADTDPCTDDKCKNGQCDHPRKPDCCTAASECDDLKSCTRDTCETNVCKHVNTCACQLDSDCGDPGACTKVSCVSNACKNEDIDNCCTSANDCNDNDPCTDDSCVSTQCLNKSHCCTSNGECDDDNACTTDTCESGACKRANNTEACNDNIASTSNDRCSGGTCGGTPPDSDLEPEPEPGQGATRCATDGDCDDGDGCSDDLCDSTGACRHQTVPDCCGGDEDCDDNDDCTEDVCDRAGSCRHQTVPDCCEDECCSDDDCADDDEFCNGVPTCDDGECVDGEPPCDANTETCNEEDNLCEAESGAGQDVAEPVRTGCGSLGAVLTLIGVMGFRCARVGRPRSRKGTRTE